MTVEKQEQEQNPPESRMRTGTSDPDSIVYYFEGGRT